jgi:hypothetical protein
MTLILWQIVYSRDSYIGPIVSDAIIQEMRNMTEMVHTYLVIVIELKHYLLTNIHT